MHREAVQLGIPTQVCDAIIDRICAVGRQSNIFYRWRAHLPDPNDDFLLELAVGCNADFLVTHNVRHLAAASKFGIKVVTPAIFLRTIEAGTI